MDKTIVYCPGVWDLLHIGHINFLKRAKVFGDKLIVGVQSDELVNQEKGHNPEICLKDRIDCLEALECVDMAVPYYNYEYKDHISSVNGKIFVTSDTYKVTDKFKSLKDAGYEVIYLPYTKGISSSKIREDINTDNAWREIWNNIGKKDIDDIKINSSNMTQEKLKSLSQYIINKAKLHSFDKVLDYGCGSGKVLMELYKELHISNPANQFYGIDISESMVARAKKNILFGIFLVDNHIPFYDYFDLIYSCATFQYFENFEYLKTLIKEMKSKTSKILLIDIPDIEHKDKREKMRNELGKETFPKHLYYNKKFFEDLGFKVWDNDTDFYYYSEYSFNALWERF